MRTSSTRTTRRTGSRLSSILPALRCVSALLTTPPSRIVIMAQLRLEDCLKAQFHPSSCEVCVCSTNHNSLERRHYGPTETGSRLSSFLTALRCSFHHTSLERSHNGTTEACLHKHLASPSQTLALYLFYRKVSVRPFQAILNLR